MASRLYRISPTAFFYGQLVFWLWNSVNDPLFAWFSDKAILTTAAAAAGAGTSDATNSSTGHPNASLKNGSTAAAAVRISLATLQRRLRALTLAGPLMSLCFLSFWFRWTESIPIHFVVSLCAYDGFLTFVDLQHQALMADLVVTVHDRVELSRYSSIGSLIGCVSVFVSYAVWNATNLAQFQLFCTLLSVLSAIAFVLSGAGLLRLVTQRSAAKTASSMQRVTVSHDSADAGHATNGILPTPEHSSHHSVQPQPTPVSFLQFLRQMLGYRNFLSFTVVSLVQTFHCHFNSNFFPLFLHYLLRDVVSPATASILLGISFVLPHLNNLYFSSLSERIGVYRVVRGLLAAKLVIAGALVLFGTSSQMLLTLFILSNRIFSEGTCKLLGLVTSDLVDEDYIVHHRDQAVSALVFGTTNLVSKAGQSLAPVLGTWFLIGQAASAAANSGAAPIQSHLVGGVIGAVAEEGSILASIESFSPQHAQQVMLGMLVAVPVVCACIQLAAWHYFTLHGAQLQYVKTAISAREGSGHAQA
ncbi:transmembrane protein [Capsaspora owczarzaki ATCC 30864]|uniref:transmembrane protein n=1 Tax=Capsaspora owczarzaki (strain ATCC 30864) TaxID=595528 RepID=UPI0001FE49C0|nr:transmembrane protein [Capsaspora owczarzaki ATCC 30864]|eukprot:XP_004365139.1 transmembrane protein [Capsaspora owczarzaki ATCC 30864]